MRIALDYDKTYTAMPEVWDQFIGSARAAGHIVEIVTMRYNNETEAIPFHVLQKVDHVVYTGRKGKARHMQFIERPVDIWIDDMPMFILDDAWTGD
jgi:hypothetical protein